MANLNPFMLFDEVIANSEVIFKRARITFGCLAENKIKKFSVESNSLWGGNGKQTMRFHFSNENEQIVSLSMIINSVFFSCSKSSICVIFNKQFINIINNNVAI